MNTKHLKSYAPKARRDFAQAVINRAAHFGIYQDRTADVQFDGSSAIIEGRVFDRKQGQQRNTLVKRIEELGTTDDKLNYALGFEQFINEIAFTWFNRLTAIRYMEINEYLDHGFRVLSKSEGAKFGEGFEILGSAADVAEDLELNKEEIIDMVLAGNQEDQLYRTILLGQCHQLSKSMPFMFEKLEDATELLLPDNLTKTDSILKDLINDVPEEGWQDIEVIGWLYQFYISERKDIVMGKVVKAEDIPAATQLFTPNWIVKYLVQNSLGHKWMQSYPNSELEQKMEYYITPAEQSDEVIAQLKAITPDTINPEEIKIIDAACGSGHILVEVYELLREIYLECGYRPREIPELILTRNIYGLDIDDRAAQMAAFAVIMKARQDDKRILDRIENNDLHLNIYSMQSSVHLNIPQLWQQLDLEGKHQAGSSTDLFANETNDETDTGNINADFKPYFELLNYLKAQFLQAKNLGSLIEIEAKQLQPLHALQEMLYGKQASNDTVAAPAAEVLLPIVNQAIVLATRYDMAVKNPPYMGSKGMNADIKAFAKKTYPNSKSDLFAMFMERAFNLLNKNGYNAQVNMQAWMFINRFETLRGSLLDIRSILTLAQFGTRAFSQISGEVVQTCAWVMKKKHQAGYLPSFNRLVEGNEEDKKTALLENQYSFKHISQTDFHLIPGLPIAYWVPHKLFDAFKTYSKMSDVLEPREGLATGNNERHVRYWYELDESSIAYSCESREAAISTNANWFPYNKGGEKKKWYGNDYFVVNWHDDGHELQTTKHASGTRIWAHNFNLDYIFRPMISWSDITTKGLSARYFGAGYLFDATGLSAFEKNDNENVIYKSIALCNSAIGNYTSSLLNPTLHFKSGDFARMFFPEVTLQSEGIINLSKQAVELSKGDFDSFENSREFNNNPIISNVNTKLRVATESYLKTCEECVNKLFEIEGVIDDIYISELGINAELFECENTPTLICNHKHTFENKEDSQVKFKSWTIANYVSYSIGCMMGRYTLERDGLIYAQSGNNGFDKLVAAGTYNTFPADDDGIIPLASEDWLFDDDATARFRAFVKTVWGEAYLQENIDFVAESLCLDAIKAKKNESSIGSIRRYLSTQFYKDHLKTYKKRPIYWLFSSGKEKAFECLVYLHRYNEGTLSRMRTEYVTPLMGKLESRKTMLQEHRDSATASEQRAMDKELKTIDKKQAELRSFDEELKHFAEMKINLDLDDGVKVNYGKFGNLLADVKAIHGKKPEELN